MRLTQRAEPLFEGPRNCSRRLQNASKNWVDSGGVEKNQRESMKTSKVVEGAHLVASDRKLCSVAPVRVRRVDEHDLTGITPVPGVFGHARLVARGLGREGSTRPA